MSEIKFEEIEYKRFGRCLKISNGKIDAVVTLDFGPRIIRYAFCGGENIMWEDTDGVFVEDYFGEEWRLYGGHRLLISPESIDSYVPDNSPVDFEMFENGARFTPPPNKKINIQCEFTVTMSETGTDVTVAHKIKNIGKDCKRFTSWGISSLSGGGIELIPQGKSDDIYTPNRRFAFWPASKTDDKRLIWGNKFLLLKHDAENTSTFKIGLYTGENRAMYFNHGDVFTVSYDYDDSITYPDSNVPYETFTNQYFLETETLGEYKSVMPGESVSHNEYWSLKKAELPSSPTDEFFENQLK